MPSTNFTARSTALLQAIVFMATPHFGSNIAALGWSLRGVPGLGAVPAPSLARLQPGPHLDQLNATLEVILL